MSIGERWRQAGTTEHGTGTGNPLRTGREVDIRSRFHGQWCYTLCVCSGRRACRRQPAAQPRVILTQGCNKRGLSVASGH